MAPQKSRARKPSRKIKSAPRKAGTDSILLSLAKNNADTAPKAATPAKRFMPPPPTDVLDGVGAKEWKRVCELLSDDDMLTELDTSTLMLYCDAFSDFHRAVKELKKKDEGIVKTGKTNGGQFRNPWYDIKKKAAQEMNQYSVLLGFSPHDRARIKRASQPTGNGNQPPNEFDGI